ncbi:MAG: cytidylate kinase-like family protein [Acidobacteriota bacterium]|nr:cytidylate kinase-like family protein [Acidobacteriota bacterium]MDH3523169.1 cytidylate kinase-like family protein [Acidobacteriota bacterium]
MSPGVDSRITSHAVESQMRNWELARLQRAARPREARPEVEDFVTISREVGVQGEEVADRLGERLGWPVLGRKILETMAGDDAIRRRIYESMDQRDLKWYQGALFAIFVKDFGRNDYFRRLCETVLSLARQGPAVFVGRGCDRLLPAHHGLRVRLIAPAAERQRAFARERGLEAAEAAREMERITRERAEFLEHHFAVDAEDPTRHDLTINLGTTSADEAVDIILAARDARRRARAGRATPAG